MALRLFQSDVGECLRAVVAQQLIPKVDGGRVAAVEILFSSPSIGNMVREGKTGQIASAIATGVKHGMIDMDSSIQALLDEGTISPQAAIDHAMDKEQFRSLVASETWIRPRPRILPVHSARVPSVPVPERSPEDS